MLPTGRVVIGFKQKSICCFGVHSCVMLTHRY